LTYFDYINPKRANGQTDFKCVKICLVRLSNKIAGLDWASVSEKLRTTVVKCYLLNFF